jgi:DNA N-6-adenine-methyltransferase (Dam)
MDSLVVPTDSPTAPLYESARIALAEAYAIDEVKSIRDKFVAIQVYAKQAKDTQLLQHATEIRMRAERRAGELLREMEKASGADYGGRPKLDGSRALPSNPPPTLTELGVTKTQSSKWQKCAALPADKFEIRVAHAKAKVEWDTTSAPQRQEAVFTADAEWFTSAEYIEAAREVLGEIDVDPASHVIAQTTVRAKRYFTVRDDRLAQPWTGRVWLNPPFTKEFVERFINKLVDQVRGGHVVAAVAVTPNFTDTAWWHRAARAASSICLKRGRIRWIAPSGDECSLWDGQTFFYFGADAARFDAIFGKFGLIVRLK